MELCVMNPAFPRDKRYAVALTKEQFAAVHDYVVACVNDRKRPKDAEVIRLCAEAGLPIDWEKATV